MCRRALDDSLNNSGAEAWTLFSILLSSDFSVFAGDLEDMANYEIRLRYQMRLEH